MSKASENIYLFVCLLCLVSFGVCIYIQYFFDVVRNKFQTIIYTRFNQEKIKSLRKEYAMWTCFKFWPMKNIFRKIQANRSLAMAWEIYRELLPLATYLRVHSNSKEVSYLSWQNKYSNLKTTCHTKLKFFLWTKLLENLLIAKYLISVAVTLNNKWKKLCCYTISKNL